MFNVGEAELAQDWKRGMCHCAEFSYARE